MSHRSKDPRLGEVAWRDLVRLRPWEAARELVLPLPWLAFSLLLADRGLLPLALAASAIFFLAGQRQAHDALHRTLGVPRTASDLVLAAQSVLLVGSQHAVRVTHLLHHRRCLEEDDLEGESGRMGVARSLLTGPLLFVRKHLLAWREGTPAERRWIALETALGLTWPVLAFTILDSLCLRYHALAMAAGNWLYPFFSVWVVHRGCVGYRYLARTVRGRFLDLATLRMFHHTEHHLFPSVPTCRLVRLAERIDRAAPGVRERTVL